MKHEDMDAEALHHAAEQADLPVNEETTPLLRKTSAYALKRLDLATRELGAVLVAEYGKVAATLSKALTKHTS